MAEEERMNPFFDGRTPKIQRLEKVMNEAAAKRDNITYVLTCNLLGRNPDYRDLYEQGAVELMRRRKRTLENHAYQNVIQSREEPSDYDRRKTTKISYAKFLRLTDSSGVNPYDAFSEHQYSEKMGILRESGYDKLTGKGGKGIPIKELRPSQVLHAFSKVYLTAMRWAEKQIKQSQLQAKPERKYTQTAITGQADTIRQETSPTRKGKRRRKIDTQPLLFHTGGRI